jgi:hypothetical protein
MNAPDKHTTGLYSKFIVNRTDGRDAPGEKHFGCDYFVLDLTHDNHAISAILAYADSCANSHPVLASDLKAKASEILAAANRFITVPEVTLPSGKVVPSFQVAQFITGKGPGDVPLFTDTATPWVEIDFSNAKKVAANHGYAILTETQALAIAWDASQQHINWTSGKVGEGKLYQGLHKGTVDEAMPATFESNDPEERRWLQLSNGARIYDFAGNVFTWIFDDVQGDEDGLTTKIANDSISLTTAPFGSQEKGMGWRPDGARDWSGGALVRGGCWYSGSYAGAFRLDYGWPGYRRSSVGFRCTKPGL